MNEIRNKLIKIVGLGLVSYILNTPVAIASAVTINFDNINAPSGFNNQTPLTEEYASMGVHFNGTGEVLNSGANFGGVPLSLPFSAPNFLAFNNSVGAFPPETISFDFLADSFSLDFAGSSGTISLSGFLGATLVDTVSTAVTFNTWNSLTLAGGSYDKIIFDVSSTDGGFVVDNVAINAIPIPATVWLFYSALLGLWGFKRKTGKEY